MRRMTFGTLVLLGLLVLTTIRPLPEVGQVATAVAATGASDEGFVLLDVAIRRHPLWGELIALEREMESCKADWQRQVDASCITESDIAACYEAGEEALAEGVAGGTEGGRGSLSGYSDALAKELEGTEARLAVEASERAEAHAAEARAGLDDDLYAERARLNREFDAFRAKMFKEYYLSLFNAQMKLTLLKPPEAERKALQEKLAGLTAEMQARIEARQNEVDAVYAAYSERKRAEAEAEIEKFRTEQERAVSSRLEEERARLEKGLADVFLAMELSLQAEGGEWRDEAARRAKTELAARREQIATEFRAREAAFTAKWEALKSHRDGILARIRDDVYMATREVETNQGITVTVLDGPAAAQPGSAGRDFTEQVLRVIRQW